MNLPDKKKDFTPESAFGAGIGGLIGGYFGGKIGSARGTAGMILGAVSAGLIGVFTGKLLTDSSDTRKPDENSERAYQQVKIDDNPNDNAPHANRILEEKKNLPRYR